MNILSKENENNLNLIKNIKIEIIFIYFNYIVTQVS